MWWFFLLLSSSSTKNQAGGQEGIVSNCACLQTGGPDFFLGGRQHWKGQMCGHDPGLVPVFFAVVFCSLLSLSVVPIVLLPSPRQGSVIDAGAQRHRQMLWGKLSVLGCYLRLHACLKELAPTHQPLPADGKRSPHGLRNRKMWVALKEPIDLKPKLCGFGQISNPETI